MNYMNRGIGSYLRNTDEARRMQDGGYVTRYDPNTRRYESIDPSGKVAYSVGSETAARNYTNLKNESAARAAARAADRSSASRGIGSASGNVRDVRRASSSAAPAASAFSASAASSPASSSPAARGGFASQLASAGLQESLARYGSYENIPTSTRRSLIGKIEGNIRDDEARKLGYSSFADLMAQGREQGVNFGRPEDSQLASDYRSILNVAMPIANVLRSSDAQNTFNLLDVAASGDPDVARAVAATAAASSPRVPRTRLNLEDPDRVIPDVVSGGQIPGTDLSYRFQPRAGGNQNSAYIQILNPAGDIVYSQLGTPNAVSFERLAPQLSALGLTTEQIQPIYQSFAAQFTDIPGREIDPASFSDFEISGPPVDFGLASDFLLPADVASGLYSAAAARQQQRVPLDTWLQGEKSAKYLGRMIQQLQSQGGDPEYIAGQLANYQGEIARLAEQTGFIVDPNTGELLYTPERPEFRGMYGAPASGTMPSYGGGATTGVGVTGGGVTGGDIITGTNVGVGVGAGTVGGGGPTYVSPVDTTFIQPGSGAAYNPADLPGYDPTITGARPAPSAGITPSGATAYSPYGGMLPYEFPSLDLPALFTGYLPQDGFVAQGPYNAPPLSPVDYLRGNTAMLPFLP